MTSEERLAQIEVKVESIHENVGYLRDKFDKLDEKYAGKWSERVLAGAILLIIGTLVAIAAS